MNKSEFNQLEKRAGRVLEQSKEAQRKKAASEKQREVERSKVMKTVIVAKKPVRKRPA